MPGGLRAHTHGFVQAGCVRAHGGDGRGKRFKCPNLCRNLRAGFFLRRVPADERVSAEKGSFIPTAVPISQGSQLRQTADLIYRAQESSRPLLWIQQVNTIIWHLK